MLDDRRHMISIKKRNKEHREKANNKNGSEKQILLLKKTMIRAHRLLNRYI